MMTDTLERPGAIDMAEFDFDAERTCDQHLPPNFDVTCNKPAAWLYTMVCCNAQETACEACHRRINTKTFLATPQWRCQHCGKIGDKMSDIVGRMVRI